MQEKNKKKVVLLPCYNEEITIGKTVKDFRKYVPDAEILVYDNNSTDKTAYVAEKAGATVIHSPLQGKGNVVQQMFREVKADVYLIADGDYTYPAQYAKELIDGVLSGYDMVVGDRLSGNYYSTNDRIGHGFGNWLVCFLIKTIYNENVPDVMSGYRALSRQFVRTIHPTSKGFEIETELSILAIRHHMKIRSVPIHCRNRPEGSESKLSTVKDGAKILWTILSQLNKREHKNCLNFCRRKENYHE